MTPELSRDAASLADLAHTLESGERIEERLRRAAEQVRGLTGSDACAIVHAVAHVAPAAAIAPALEGPEAERLARQAGTLLDAVLDRGAEPVAAAPLLAAGDHLAVPLVALGDVVGVVLVERAGGEYANRELQLLAVAASQLGAFLATLQAREEQRQTEAALREALETTRELHERKSHFLNVLSHELRNPLAPLMNAVHVLERSDPAAEPAVRARAIVGRQVEHLSRLIEDLLDETRISTGKVHLRRARIDLAEIVRRTVEDHRPIFQRGGVALELRAPDRAAVVDADATRIAQVVGNLLANAQKFTAPGGRVVVTVERANPTAVVRVRDDGVGMTSETLARAFDRYAQGDDTLPRSRAGLGLGLALAKGLVELHGGSISAASDGPGKGAEFTVRLPLAPGDAPADAEPGAPALPVPRARRILVIDDNRDAADALRELLELSGHAVEVAADGPAGVALALRAAPDVILCDLDLPGMSGFEVARALRAAPALAGTVLVAVTGLGSADARVDARASGFAELLLKPVALPDLQGVLVRTARAPDAPPATAP